MNGLKNLILLWIMTWVKWYRRLLLKRKVAALELDLVRLKVDMEQTGTWDGNWRSVYAALRLLPTDLIQQVGELQLLRVTATISEGKLDRWMAVLSRVVGVYCRTCEYRKRPKDQRVADGTYFHSGSDDYVLVEDSLLMLMYQTQYHTLQDLIDGLISTIEPLISQDYEALLEPADISYLDRTTGYMQDEMMEVVRAIVECLTNLKDTVD